jgi:putative acetyltransferase
MMNIEIRPVRREDIKGVETLIKTVMPEYGASGPGFAIHDPEVLNMFEAYDKPGHAYFVVVQGDDVLGGGGIAPLSGETGVCELRKMYFKKVIRGQGLGQKLMDMCLEMAKQMGYKKCYLETLFSMKEAQKLYQRNGFVPLDQPMGNTGHFSCDSFYIKSL